MTSNSNDNDLLEKHGYRSHERNPGLERRVRPVLGVLSLVTMAGIWFYDRLGLPGWLFTITGVLAFACFLWWSAIHVTLWRWDPSIEDTRELAPWYRAPEGSPAPLSVWKLAWKGCSVACSSSPHRQ